MGSFNNSHRKLFTRTIWYDHISQAKHLNDWKLAQRSQTKKVNYFTFVSAATKKMIISFQLYARNPEK